MLFIFIYIIKIDLISIFFWYFNVFKLPEVIVFFLNFIDKCVYRKVLYFCAVTRSFLYFTIGCTTEKTVSISLLFTIDISTILALLGKSIFILQQCMFCSMTGAILSHLKECSLQMGPQENEFHYLKTFLLNYNEE